MINNNIVYYIKKNIQKLKPHYVSFDCFDTLLCRVSLLPTDLFKILELRVNKEFKNKYLHFAQIRTTIEKQLRQLKKSHYIAEVTLDEIYDHLAQKTHIKAQDITRIKQIELDIELQYSQARSTIKKLYNYCIEHNYKVIVISDTYFPKHFIEELLNKNGYTDIYKLYVSSANKLTKGSGNLFKYVINDLNTNYDKIYHIGDNLYADYKKALENQINATHIHKCTDNFFANPINQNLWLNSKNFPILNKIHLGQMANSLYDDQIIKGNMNIFGNDYQVLGSHLGHMVFTLALWLIKLAEKYQVKHINLTQRDGYLLLHIIPLICEYYPYKVKLNYIPLSRAVSVPLYLNTKFDYLDINNILPCNVSISNFLKQRMLIDDYQTNKSVQTILTKHNIKNLEAKTRTINIGALSLDLAPISLQYVKKKKEILNNYLKRHIKKEKNILIYDSGYSARPQLMLETAFPNAKVIGAYFTSFVKLENTACNKNNTYNFAPYFDSGRQNFEPIILEIIMSDIHVESVIGINNNLEPIYETPNKGGRLLQTNKRIHELQQTIIAYSKDFMEVVKNDIALFTVFPYYSTKIYEYIHNNITKEDAKLIENISYLVDSSVGGAKCLQNHPILKEWRRKEIYE